MSPSPSPQGSVRPSAVVNEDIRRLWRHPSMRLTVEQRREYQRLIAEWETAKRAEIVKAA